MPNDEVQKLKIMAEALGFEVTAKKIDQVSGAKDKLAKKVEEGNKTFEKAKAKVGEYVDSIDRMKGRIEDVGESIKKTAQSVSDGARRFADMSKWVGGAAATVTLLGLAMRTTLGVFRMIPAASGIIRGIRGIVGAIKDEITERKRLVEVMKVQGRVMDELRSKQLSQKATLERIAGRRPEGGFASADVARRVQLGAARAGEQFTQLQPEDINQAFGLFGDLGLSQRALTELAIIASFDELNVNRDMPPEHRKRWQEDKRRRMRERIDKFARVETVQGQGPGWTEFRPAGPTERASRAIAEARATGGSTETLRERLTELLMPGDDIDLAVLLAGTYTVEELEAAKRHAAHVRPARALGYRMGAVPRVEVALSDQPGYWAQFKESIFGSSKYEQMTVGQYERLQRALQQIEKEGLYGRGQPAPAATDVSSYMHDLRFFGPAGPRGTAAEMAPQIVHNTYNYQNAKFNAADARSQRRRIRNGETLLQERANR